MDKPERGSLQGHDIFRGGAGIRRWATLGARTCPGTGSDLPGGTCPFVSRRSHHAHVKDLRRKKGAARVVHLAERKVERYPGLLPGHETQSSPPHVLFSSYASWVHGWGPVNPATTSSCSSRMNAILIYSGSPGANSRRGFGFAPVMRTWTRERGIRLDSPSTMCASSSTTIFHCSEEVIRQEGVSH